ncbi:MAG: S1C family serine protease [Oscillospiraceae bacterium]|nr:S1C family serine protease [Oscillospiraceae bacterium]
MKTTIGGKTIGRKNISKKAISITLCIVILVSMMPVFAFGAGRVTTFEEMLANDLKTLGLFRGVSDTDFDLNRAPSRIEALVMLIRVLGKEAEALSSSNPHPFTDVAGWADPYVGYAYANNLTNGISETQFGTGRASAAMFLTFVLRALDYDDTNGADFTWSHPYTLAKTIGILPDFIDINNFWRADVVVISYASLAVTLKNSNQTLAQRLIDAAVFTKETFDLVYRSDAINNYVPMGPVELNAEEIYALCSPAVFHIDVFDADDLLYYSGSGFFIDSSGIAVTTYYVLESGQYAKITLSDTGEEYNVVGYFDYDEYEDWAIIKVDGSGFPSLKIGDFASVVSASSAFVIDGSIRGQNTISQGIISNPNINDGWMSYIQYTAPIPSESNGGALINKYGEVIGITQSRYGYLESLNMAIPIPLINNYNSNTIYALSQLPPLYSSGGSYTRTIDTSNSVDFSSYGEEVLVTDQTVYKFTPNQDGVWIFVTSENGNDDPVLYLYNANGNLIAVNDDGVGDFNAIIFRHLEAGNTYYIEASFYDTEFGSCTLSVYTSEKLQGTEETITVNGDTIYTFTPSQSGIWIFMTQSIDENDPVLYIYKQDSSYITGADDNAGGLDAIIAMYFEAGETYIIDLWFYNMDTQGTTCSLSISMYP